MIPATVVATPRKRVSWRRVLVGVVVLGAVGAAASGVLRKPASYELPTYLLVLRPVYGTVVVSIDETVGTEVTKATITTNNAASVLHMVSSADSTTPSVDMITDGVTLFGKTPATGGWVRTQYDQPEIFRSMAALATVFVFEDVVPEVARPFVAVRSKQDRVLDGTKVTRYELVIDEKKFAKEQPASYTAWAAKWTPDGNIAGRADRSRMVLWLDSDGVVWEMDSISDLSTDRSTLKVVSFTQDEFVPPYPTSYLDMINGVQVNG